LFDRIAGFAAALERKPGSLRRDRSAKRHEASSWIAAMEMTLRRDIRAAISNAPAERLSPAEKKLIALSLAIGLALLALLAAVNHFIPARF
jgi:hypothetical protein